jgi:hypothetical protein
MRRRTISARWFLPIALLTLLVVPAAVATGVWFLEAQRQRDQLARQLQQASAYLQEHVDPNSESIPRAELQRYLDGLGIRAQLTLINE